MVQVHMRSVYARAQRLTVLFVHTTSARHSIQLPARMMASWAVQATMIATKWRGAQRIRKLMGRMPVMAAQRQAEESVD